MNCYVLIPMNKLEQAKALAPVSGLPNQLFQSRICPDGTKAIVHADWINESIFTFGTMLGDLNPDGFADQAVYDELAKAEWQQ